MPRLAPHLRLLDPSRQQRLHGAAHPLPLADRVEERGGVVAVDASRVERASRRLQRVDSATNLPQHASSRERTDRGKRREVPMNLHEHMFAVKPRARKKCSAVRYPGLDDA
jgi:hypothetical protein